MSSAAERAAAYYRHMNDVSAGTADTARLEVETPTLLEQRGTERAVQRHFRLLQENPGSAAQLLALLRPAHRAFLVKRLHALPTAFESLDASQPWLCYWTVHALYLLAKAETPAEVEAEAEAEAEPRDFLSAADRRAIVALLMSCLSVEGGFAGGPHQMAHLATTYGALNCLVEVGGVADLAAVPRGPLRRWLLRLRTPDGAFRLQEDGEVDVRGAYCALSVARLLGLLEPALVAGTADWLVRCQTYEGGFGAAPGLEAHGGYTFCGFAALHLLGKAHLCDLGRLTRWAASRQMAFEGGFQGRTNKLVDSCYSWWVGGLFPLLHQVLAQLGDAALAPDHWLCDTDALQEYLLLCCQRPQGGLIDKPGRNPDPYHCCYALSGLSTAQHFDFARFAAARPLGSSDNLLAKTDSVHNVGVDCVAAAISYFQNKPVED